MTCLLRRPARGYVLLLALIFTGIFLTVSTALVGYVLSYGRAGTVAIAAAQALAIAEGALDTAIDELNQDPGYAGEADTPLGAGTFSISIANIDSKTRRITATAHVPDRAAPLAVKSIQANAGITDAIVSFRYGIQAGDGGITLRNNATVTGNVFSNGSVIGDSQNYIYGDVISAGPNGLVYGIHATSSVYAHTIGNASESTVIDKNAYYTSLINATVTGTPFPGSPDQATTSLPISDAHIAQWEAQATAGGTAACEGGRYSISSGSVTLGPLKIPCDLDISNNAVVTLRGHIWVMGNITIQNSATVRMDPLLGAKNIVVIADNPADRLAGSLIRVKNTASFQNSGTPGSFIFLISQNNSAENGGTEEAFNLSNSASALVAYAPHGLIPVTNNVSLKEVAAYKISLANLANVTYDTGLQHAVFESGPGASWRFVPGTYAITR